jgi:hypothetical protein
MSVSRIAASAARRKPVGSEHTSRLRAIRAGEHGLEAAAFGGLFVSLFGLYWLLGFPIYNDAAWLDPWYYTGLWINYDFLRPAYHGAYYVTRIPWIAPGRVVFALLPPTAAYLVIHIIFALLAAFCLYFLFRRFLGVTPALAGIVGAGLNPLVYHALYRDYVVAGELTFLFASMYFGLAARAGRRPALAMGAAGFFVASAFSTHFFSSIFSATLVVPYVLLFRPTWRVVRRDLAAFLAGAGALFVLCTVYSVAQGGPLFYLGPALHTTGDLSLSQYHLGGVSWMLSEPRLLVPPFLVIVAALLLVRSRRRGTFPALASRFSVAIVAYGAAVWAIVTAWEFVGGIVYENIDYTEPFLAVCFVPLFAVCMALVLDELGVASRRSTLIAAGIILAFAFLPVFLIYRLDWTDITARRGAVATVLLMLVAVLALIGARALPRATRKVAAFGGLALLVLASSYPVAASNLTLSAMNYDASTNRRNTDVFHVSVAWVRWMRSAGLQHNDMVTWYDVKTTPWGNAIASMYFLGWSLQGTNMPVIDAHFRQQWSIRNHPSEIVLLCSSPRCEGAQEVLRRGGYPAVVVAQKLFARGMIRLWVKVLRESKVEVNTTTEWYVRGESALVPAPTRRPVMRVNFADPLPARWNSEAPIRTRGDLATLDTSTRPYNYEMTSRTTTLAPGSYRLYLRGRVVRGGVDLGVLDVSSDTWIAQRTYWYGQPGFARGWMSTPFVLSDSTAVQFVLSNWAPSASSSRWQLRDLQLVRTK